ncbi:UNVERIFIED_CONTAM: hypothetical protein FKN15_044449 [Acipenser sinensis]
MYHRPNLYTRNNDAIGTQSQNNIHNNTAIISHCFTNSEIGITLNQSTKQQEKATLSRTRTTKNEITTAHPSCPNAPETTASRLVWL